MDIESVELEPLREYIPGDGKQAHFAEAVAKAVELEGICGRADIDPTIVLKHVLAMKSELDLSERRKFHEAAVEMPDLVWTDRPRAFEPPPWSEEELDDMCKSLSKLSFPVHNDDDLVAIASEAVSSARWAKDSLKMATMVYEDGFFSAERDGWTVWVKFSTVVHDRVRSVSSVGKPRLAPATLVGMFSIQIGYERCGMSNFEDFCGYADGETGFFWEVKNNDRWKFRFVREDGCVIQVEPEGVVY